MQSNLIQIDNALGNTHLGLLQDTLLSEMFGWYFHPDINHGVSENDPTKVGFVHTLIKDDNYQSDYASLFAPVMWKAIDETKEKAVRIVRFKANMTLNMTGIEKTTPHQDIALECEPEWNLWSAIFYPFDVDGDTVFYGNNKTTETKRITPKANTMVLFDSMTFHHGFLPRVSANRIVVNVAFATLPK